MTALRRTNPIDRASIDAAAAKAMVDCWHSGLDELFTELVESVIERGDDEVFRIAVELCRAEHGAEAANNLLATIKLRAEIDYFNFTESDVEVTISSDVAYLADLMAIAVIPIPGRDGIIDSLHRSLSSSGMFSRNTRFTFLPGWSNPDAVHELSPCQTRAILRVMCDESAKMPAGFTMQDKPNSNGFSIILGAAVRPLDDDDENNIMYSDEENLLQSFVRWRHVLTELCPTLFEVITPCSPSSLRFELSRHLSSLSSAATSGRGAN